jgi:hypothetical protein
MKHTFISLLILALIFLQSCKENEDVVQAPNRQGSVEAQIEILRSGNTDVLKTTKKVWVKGNLFREFVSLDTIPSLGTTTEEGEDQEGNTKMITVPKDYEIYITVK